MALLSDPSRRALYDHVRSAVGPVTRDEAAAGAGVSRKLAAFHLDRLVQGGLLRATYARPAGRPRGPGRPAKTYERSEAGIELSIPRRQYAMVAEILLDAMATADHSGSAGDAALRAARRRGVEAGEVLRGDRRLHRPGRVLRVAAGLLGDLGFEPVVDGDRQVLRPRNCPFRQLAEYSSDLVCGLNAAFLDGVLSGIGNDKVTAVPTDADGGCCVELRASPT